MMVCAQMPSGWSHGLSKCTHLQLGCKLSSEACFGFWWTSRCSALGCVSFSCRSRHWKFIVQPFYCYKCLEIKATGLQSYQSEWVSGLLGCCLVNTSECPECDWTWWSECRLLPYPSLPWVNEWVHQNHSILVWSRWLANLAGEEDSVICFNSESTGGRWWFECFDLLSSFGSTILMDLEMAWQKLEALSSRELAHSTEDFGVQ